MMRIKKSWPFWVSRLWWGPRLPITRSRKATFRPQLERLEDRPAPATITVTSFADNDNVDQQVTLDEAILSVNQGRDWNADVTPNRVGAYGNNDTIIFDIGNAPQTINVQIKPLPAIVKPVTIDGTPPATKLNQTIELTPTTDPDPSKALPATANGLTFSAGANGSKVYGLTIDRFPSDGILLDNVSSVKLGAANGTNNSRGNPITLGKGELIIYR